jgi:Flp pilus assembly protein TadG
MALRRSNISNDTRSKMTVYFSFAISCCEANDRSVVFTAKGCRTAVKGVLTCCTKAGKVTLE